MAESTQEPQKPIDISNATLNVEPNQSLRQETVPTEKLKIQTTPEGLTKLSEKQLIVELIKAGMVQKIDPGDILPEIAGKYVYTEKHISEISLKSKQINRVVGLENIRKAQKKLGDLASESEEKPVTVSDVVEASYQPPDDETDTKPAENLDPGTKYRELTPEQIRAAEYKVVSEGEPDLMKTENTTRADLIDAAMEGVNQTGGVTDGEASAINEKILTPDFTPASTQEKPEVKEQLAQAA